MADTSTEDILDWLQREPFIEQSTNAHKDRAVILIETVCQQAAPQPHVEIIAEITELVAIVIEFQGRLLLRSGRSLHRLSQTERAQSVPLLDRVQARLRLSRQAS